MGIRGGLLFSGSLSVSLYSCFWLRSSWAMEPGLRKLGRLWKGLGIVGGRGRVKKSWLGLLAWSTMGLVSSSRRSSCFGRIRRLSALLAPERRPPRTLWGPSARVVLLRVKGVVVEIGVPGLN